MAEDQPHMVITCCDYIMQPIDVPCPLIRPQIMSGSVMDEMFRRRIVERAGILDQFTCTMETMMVLAKIKVGSIFADTPWIGSVGNRTLDIEPRREIALAYAQQLSRIPR